MSISQHLHALYISSSLPVVTFWVRASVNWQWKKKEEGMLLRTVESIIAPSSVNLYFMTAFHPSSKQQVDEQTLRMLKPPNPPSSPYSCRSCGTGDFKSSLLTSFLFFLPASRSPLRMDLRDHCGIWKSSVYNHQGTWRGHWKIWFLSDHRSPAVKTAKARQTLLENADFGCARK